ncbi:unnamed protein product [Rotaria sp. Silwood2]|nr:unnamed protein product [Rotaria sp. Silwood2]
MFRDLFLWFVFMDMPEMAKVLLLRVQSRICAALIASAIFKTYSKLSQTVDLKSKFRTQSLEFETYAAAFIDTCYEYSKQRACELLLRQIPLFGNVTCMQIAIASGSKIVLKTACFDQTLNQVWYNKLCLTNRQTPKRLSQISSILTFGLVAPWIISYREENKESMNNTKDDRLSEEGINYYADEKSPKERKRITYWRLFRYFHESPFIKMSYHFISYVWFLLVFSYMMLYHLDGRNTFTIPHWTEIYVIFTVTTMLCEEGRKFYHEYNTRMTERWGATGSSILSGLTIIFYIMPYLLFYLGLGFRYSSYNEDLLSTTKIIWALDLELWYLRSITFVMASKFLGSKLFMLKNILRDLFAFVYMIFIAVTAYGVVSRALLLYKEVPFTGRGIFNQIFYEPYWLIYGEVSDKDLLDNAWILTAGINNGVSKLVGEGISHYRLLQEYPNKVKCIGMTMWGTINENTRLEFKNASNGFPKPLCERQIPDNVQEYKETIERNHTHCILFDSGRLNEYLTDTQRDQFVTEACKHKDNDHSCYAVTIIVEGGLGTLEVVENDINEKRPIVLIQVRITKLSVIFINHSTFIEYFLITGFDPLTLVEEDNISSYQTFISDLYVDTYDAMSKSHRNRIETLFGELPLKSIQELNYKLNKFVGPFFGSIYSPIDDSFVSRIKIDLSNHVFTCCKLHEYVEDNHDSKGNHDNGKNNQTNNKYTKHHMLRDLFLWSVFMDMPEMAKVLLLHVQSRICAALIATTIFKKYSNSSDTVDLKSKFLTQSLEFETYAAILIDKCYEHNEKRACELLLRQIPLFGNVTCMQVNQIKY